MWQLIFCFFFRLFTFFSFKFQQKLSAVEQRKRDQPKTSTDFCIFNNLFFLVLRVWYKQRAQIKAMDHSANDVRQVTVPMVPTITVNTSEQPNGLNGHTIYTDNSMEFSKGICLPHLPNRDPIDIQFKDITYTVKLGFNKGRFQILNCEIIRNQFSCRFAKQTVKRTILAGKVPVCNNIWAFSRSLSLASFNDAMLPFQIKNRKSMMANALFANFNLPHLDSSSFNCYCCLILLFILLCTISFRRWASFALFFVSVMLKTW